MSLLISRLDVSFLYATDREDVMITESVANTKACFEYEESVVVAMNTPRGIGNKQAIVLIEGLLFNISQDKKMVIKGSAACFLNFNFKAMHVDKRRLTQDKYLNRISKFDIRML
jgi:hypothetical protein